MMAERQVNQFQFGAKPGMRPVCLLLALTLAAAAALAKEKPPVIHRIPLPPRPDFSDLDWLIGDWSGKTTENSPKGEVSLSVSFDLDKRFMVFRGQETLAATPTLGESRESWLGLLSQDPSGGGFILRVFSDKGFITRYRVTVIAGTVSLDPEGGEQPPPGWLFRRTLQRTDIGEMLETVQVAPPQKPFFDYYAAKLTRAAPSTTLPPAAPPPEKPATE
jgi:hypothetical protein